MDTDPKDSPKPEIVRSPILINRETLSDLDALAERFAQEVIARNVYGKLPNKDNPTGDAGFFDHGPDFSIGLERIKANDFAYILLSPYYYCYDDLKMTPVAAANFLSLRKSIDHPGNLIFTMHFMQDKKQVGGAGHGTMAHVSLEFTNVVTSKLVMALVHKPDLLEHLYQKCFKGLDSTEKTLGMRRAKTTGFYFIPDNKREITDKIGRYDYEKLLAFLNSLIRYNFLRGPYGSGDWL